MTPIAFVTPLTRSLFTRPLPTSARSAPCLPPPKRLRPSPRATLVSPSPPPHDLLSRFSSAIRGEWSGYEASFDALSGASLPVPDFYIPDQFVEWGLTPHGFETTHSMIVRGTRLFRKMFRVLPAVSLFADHVDLEEELCVHELGEEEGGGGGGWSIFQEGAYVGGKAQVVAKRTSELQKWPAVEFCLRWGSGQGAGEKGEGEGEGGGEGEGEGGKGGEAVVVAVEFDFEKRAFVGKVRVIKERWSCIYCDGADIEGSSGYVEGWVDEGGGGAEAAANLAGKWRVDQGDEEEEAEEKGAGEKGNVVTREAGRAMQQGRQLYLAGGVDVGIEEAHGQGGGVVVQVGWLVDAHTHVVMRRRWDEDGRVQSSERVVEHRL